MRFPAIVFAACILAIAGPRAFADPPAAEVGRQDPSVQKVATGMGSPDPRTPGVRARGVPSEAEQIAFLERTIAVDQKRLAQLQATQDDPRQEFARAEADFERVDTQLKQKQKALQALRSDGKADRARLLEAELAASQPAWKLARERFELAIEERKALRAEIATLQRKIEHDRQALAALTGPVASAQPPATLPTPVVVAPAQVPMPVQAPDPTPAPTTTPAPAPAPGPPSAPAEDQVPPAVPAPAPPLGSAAPAREKPATAANAGPVASPADAETPAHGEGAKPMSRELVKALKEEKAEAAEVRDAEAKAQSIAERIADLDQDIALEQKLRETANRKADNAHQSQSALAEQLRARSVAGARREELVELARNARDAEQRAVAARDEVREHSGRLDQLQTERAGLLAQQVAARDRAHAEEQRLAEAQGRVRELENPFAPRNVLHWLVDHGPRMLGVGLAMLLLTWMARFSSQRIVVLVSRSGFRGSKEEREARAHTLVGVFHNAATVAIVTGGLLMMLQEAGIPIAPLLGGAAVFGLAVAFGAQNLIRDYFYGFVILLENQYKINDVVKIGSLSGSVERITLRMTVLRDGEGCVHFLPNGGITAVTNMTHGWSRSVFEVGVAYKEDVDRVMALLVEMGKELREDPTFGSMILDDLTMLGVEALGDSAVTLKFFIKTRPLKQWDIKREMLRRIKNRFDQLGIEIPFPQRVVHHRNEEVSRPPTSGTHPSLYWEGLSPDPRPETRSHRR